MDWFSSNSNESVGFPLTPCVCHSNIGLVLYSLDPTNESKLTHETSSHVLPFNHLLSISVHLTKRMSISTEAGRTHFIECNGLEPISNDHQLTPDGFLSAAHPSSDPKEVMLEIGFVSEERILFLLYFFIYFLPWSVYRIANNAWWLVPIKVVKDGAVWQHFFNDGTSNFFFVQSDMDEQ